MSVIFDHRGSGHNLALGAFDTQSIAKIGNASVLLSKYLPQTFDKSFGELISEYQFDLAKSEPSMLGKLWSDYMKPGLKHVGAQAWELTQGFAGDVIKGLIGKSSPTAALAVAAGEAILTTALGGYLEGMIPDTKSISLKRGQWLFIEDKNHLKRRLAHQNPSKPVIEPKDPSKLPKAVHLGFFVGATYKDTNMVDVFNMDTGRVEPMQINRIAETGDEIARRCDSDPVLSVVRELFFYKREGEDFQKAHPNEAIYPGRNVIHDGHHYTLIFRNEKKALIQDTDTGATHVVNESEISRGWGKSTPGEGDGFFDTHGVNLHSGQWIMVPARESVVNQYHADEELAVVANIMPKGKIQVFRAMDGRVETIDESGVRVLEFPTQSLFNNQTGFKSFRQAVVDGNASKAKQLQLGSRDMNAVLGHAMKRKQPDTEKRPQGEGVAKETVKVGSTVKVTKDVVEELQNTGSHGTSLRARDIPRETAETSTFPLDDRTGLAMAMVAVGAVILAL